MQDGWGLATDGKVLFGSDGTSTLYQIDPQTLKGFCDTKVDLIRISSLFFCVPFHSKWVALPLSRRIGCFPFTCGPIPPLSWCLYFHDAVVRKHTVKYKDHEVPNLNELEYINGEIWANVWEVWPAFFALFCIMFLDFWLACEHVTYFILVNIYQ